MRRVGCVAATTVPFARRGKPFTVTVGGLAASMLALLGARDVIAAAPPTPAVQRSPTGAAPPPAAADYSAGLTIGYVLAPLLALPIAAGLYELTLNDAVTVVGTGLAVVAVPVSIHAYNGEPGRGGTSALLLPLVTLGAMVAGGFLGVLIGTAGCSEASDCELTGGIHGAIAGGLIGGLAGYVGYAIYDVSASSSSDEARPAAGSVRVWALPVVARRELGPGAIETRVEGATLGVATTF